MDRLIAYDSYIEKALTPEQMMRIVSAASPEFRLVSIDSLTESEYPAVEIAFGFFDKERLVKMPGLKWHQICSAGADHYIGLPYLHPDFQLTNATGAFGVQISEHILSLMLGLQRGLHHYRDHQSRCEWKDAPLYTNFFGSTVAIVGMGDIGSETAKRAKALGARTLAVKRTASVKPEYVDELYFDLAESLDHILAQADFVALCLPQTPDTKFVLDDRRLSLMKEHAVIVNIGRGALIDQDALIAHLARGRFMAGLDVTTPEPLPPDNPLWKMPNCWITPHMAGRSSRSMNFIHQLFLTNLGKYKTGDRLDNPVDFRAGY